MALHIGRDKVHLCIEELTGCIENMPDSLCQFGGLPLRRVQVDDAIVGKYAAKAIYGKTGRAPLVRRGAQIRPSMVHALQRRGIEAVWVMDELFPELEAQEVVRQQTVDVTRRCLDDIFKTAKQSEGPSQPQALRLAAAVRSLVEDILQNDDVVANVGHLRAWDNYTFEHSVQVAILSVLLGKHLMMTEDQLVRLGTGAVLHDVGKVMVPQEILQKPASLTPEEFDIVRQHPRLGWDLVHDGFSSIMPTSSIVVLQHHERLDGSGYPSHLKGDEIYVFSRVVAVADVFDAVRAERNYRPTYAPRRVLQIMQEEAGPKLDREIVAALLAHVAIIPIGEIVRLTNGLLGAVTGLHPEDPLRPVVTVVADDRDMPIEREELDLRGTPLQVDQVLNAWPPGLAERAEKPARGRQTPPAGAGAEG